MSLLCNAWAPLVSDYDVIILNAGAHGPGHGFSRWLYTQNLQAAAAHVQAHARPGARLFFRNTPFGHPDCDARRYLPPLPSVESAETDLQGSRVSHDWKEFKERNRVAEPIFEAAGFQVVDVYTPTSMRSDAHIPHDCLHYCIPGPTLHWVNLVATAIHANSRSLNRTWAFTHRGEGRGGVNGTRREALGTRPPYRSADAYGKVR